MRTPLFFLMLTGLGSALDANAQIDGGLESSDHFGEAVAAGDFDGDGFDDLAVGVPTEGVGGLAEAGAVNVIYGLPGAGLTSIGDQYWHQDSPGIEGAAEAEDGFGDEVAVGDFDGDGFDDLAIGVPLEDVGSVPGAGSVNVLYGSSSGLTAAGNQLWHQDVGGVLDASERYDFFGTSVVAGDFNGDGIDDLAVGATGEDVGTGGFAGGVSVLYGSAGSGLTAAGDQFWHQDATGVLEAAETGDFFGAALAAGDFDGDGFDDLAVGVPSEEVGAVSYAGAVNVLYGSARVGLIATGNQFWSQDSPGVLGIAETEDLFGGAVAAGDFDNDGFDDLAIGTAQDDANTVDEGGAVNVLYGGSGAGLTAVGDQLWHQDSPGIEGAAEPADAFGSSLTVGDFDGDDVEDLAVGAPGEGLGPQAIAGATNVLYGSAGVGLAAAGDQLWHQDVGGVLDVGEIGDEFATALAAGDFDGDGFSDLAVGVPGETVGGNVDAGAVNALYGSSGVGLTATGDQFWYQGGTAPDPAAEEPLALDARSGARTGPALRAASPNPFAGATTLRYDVAEAGRVRLAVYDLLGREVAVLVDGAHEAGRHEAVLGGDALPAGVYLVRMTTGGGFVETRRVTLLR